VNPSGSESENEMLNYDTFFPKNCFNGGKRYIKGKGKKKDIYIYTYIHNIYIMEFEKIFWIISCIIL